MTYASQLLAQTEQTVAEEVNLLSFEDAAHVHLHATLACPRVLGPVREENSRQILESGVKVSVVLNLLDWDQCPLGRDVQTWLLLLLLLLILGECLLFHRLGQDAWLRRLDRIELLLGLDDSTVEVVLTVCLSDLHFVHLEVEHVLLADGVLRCASELIGVAVHDLGRLCRR